MLTDNGKEVPSEFLFGWTVVERDGFVVLVNPDDPGVECVLDEGTTTGDVEAFRAAAGGGG